MMREKVLALLLIVSLCANVYFIMVNDEGFLPSVPGLNTTSLNGFLGGNASEGSDYYIDEYGQVILFPTPTPSPVETPGPESGNGGGNETPSVPEMTPEPTVKPIETVLPDPWVTYSSTKYGFSLKYPRNWTINEAVAGRTVLTLTAPIETGCDKETSQCFKYIANFTVEIDQKPFTTSLEEYFNKAVSGLQLSYHITTTSKSAPAVLSEGRAYQIEYYTHDPRGNADRSFMQYYTIIDGKGYVISYFGPYSTWENVYHHNKADAQEIVDSFMVTRTFKPA